ncbi:MAG TPA: NAD(+)/NADH kinase [Thermoplasmata archaeon]|nr:NAD(+)/NADH kinase [Thermoplasmata archaeon]
MKLGLHANPQKGPAPGYARAILEQIGDRAEVVVSSEIAPALGTSVASAPLAELRGDLLIAIGGDGTFLQALQESALPLFGVNAGTFGFLAEVDGGAGDPLHEAVERLLRGDYFIEERMKLAARAGDAILPDATNEIVIHTSQVAKMRHFAIAIDGAPVGSLRADGMILATPTGSTSYALSALGPILDPGVEGIVVAAIAPFHATQRAVVVDPLRSVSVRLVDPHKDGIVVVDGKDETRLAAGASVTAYRSARRARFVRFGARFFPRLKGKRILPWSDESEGDAAVPPAA